MITALTGKYRFLANEIACMISYENESYPSVAHAFHAAKTLDLTIRAKIKKATRFYEVRQLGRDANPRPDWKEVRLSIMEDLLRQKFNYPEFKKVLLSTGNEILINGNSRGETFWGAIRVEHKWVGENNLGKLLTKIREELTEKKISPNVC